MAHMQMHDCDPLCVQRQLTHARIATLPLLLGKLTLRGCDKWDRVHTYKIAQSKRVSACGQCTHTCMHQGKGHTVTHAGVRYTRGRHSMALCRAALHIGNKLKPHIGRMNSQNRITNGRYARLHCRIRLRAQHTGRITSGAMRTQK